MRKPFTITLSILGALALILLIFLLISGFRFDFIGETRTENAYTASGTVQSVKIKAASDDVTVRPSPDGKVTVSYFEGEKSGYDIALSGGTLTVTVRPYIGFGFTRSHPLTVYLPKASLTEFTAATASGDVSAHTDIQATALTLTTASGDISAEGLYAVDIALNTASGSVSATRVTGDTATVTTASGGIAITDAALTKLTVSTASGAFRSKKLTVSSATLSSASGNIALGLCEEDAALYRFRFSSASGRIRVRGGGYELDGQKNASLGTGARAIALDSASGDLTVSFE